MGDALEGKMSYKGFQEAKTTPFSICGGGGGIIQRIN